MSAPQLDIAITPACCATSAAGVTRVEIACGQHHFHASFDEILGCARRLCGVRLGINVGQAQLFAENATCGIDIVNGDLR